MARCETGRPYLPASKSRLTSGFSCTFMILSISDYTVVCLFPACTSAFTLVGKPHNLIKPIAAS